MTRTKLEDEITGGDDDGTLLVRPRPDATPDIDPSTEAAWAMFVLLQYDHSYSGPDVSVALIAPVENANDAWRPGEDPPRKILASYEDEKLQELGLGMGDVFRAVSSKLGDNFETFWLPGGEDYNGTLSMFLEPRSYGTGEMVQLDCIWPIQRNRGTAYNR